MGFNTGKLHRNGVAFLYYYKYPNGLASASLKPKYSIFLTRPVQLNFYHCKKE